MSPLAEALDAPLLARDRKLASSAGQGVVIELLQGLVRSNMGLASLEP